MLGLPKKGHLGIGADADITIYSPSADRRAMFEMPTYVVKGGRIVVEKTEIRETPDGASHHVAPGFDEGRVPDIREWFEANYSIQFANYAVE